MKASEESKDNQRRLYEIMEFICARQYAKNEDSDLEELADEAIRQLDPDSKAPPLLRHAAHIQLAKIAFKLGEMGFQSLMSDIADDKDYLYLHWAI